LSFLTNVLRATGGDQLKHTASSAHSAQRNGGRGPAFLSHCCGGVTEYDRRCWHSGPACGRCGLRTPAAVTQAGYAYCQLRDTQLSVQTDLGTDLGATEPVGLDGFCCLGLRREKRCTAVHMSLHMDVPIQTVGGTMPILGELHAQYLSVSFRE
jgi:hypothetical protein